MQKMIRRCRFALPQSVLMRPCSRIMFPVLNQSCSRQLSQSTRYFSSLEQNVSSQPKRRIRRPRKSPLTLTPSAVERIKYLLGKSGDAENIGIEIGVRSRGCSGKSYTMRYVKRGEQDVMNAAESVEQDGVKVFIHPKAMMFVVGTVVDFVEDHIKSEFVFTNPNSKGECGCGESFNV